MTSALLRIRAGQKRAEAGDLAADADRLRGQAAALRGLLDPLLPLSQRVWLGPAAQDFEGEVRRCIGEVNTVAARLVAIAGDLDRRAAIARSMANSLDNQAATAVSGAGAIVPGVV